MPIMGNLSHDPYMRQQHDYQFIIYGLTARFMPTFLHLEGQFASLIFHSDFYENLSLIQAIHDDPYYPQKRHRRKQRRPFRR